MGRVRAYWMTTNLYAMGAAKFIILFMIAKPTNYQNVDQNMQH